MGRFLCNGVGDSGDGIRGKRRVRLVLEHDRTSSWTECKENRVCRFGCGTRFQRVHQVRIIIFNFVSRFLVNCWHWSLFPVRKDRKRVINLESKVELSLCWHHRRRVLRIPHTSTPRHVSTHSTNLDPRKTPFLPRKLFNLKSLGQILRYRISCTHDYFKRDVIFLPLSELQETPPTPLFDEDVSQPLEDFPRVTYTGDGWDMHLRQPNKKKITGQRFWKKIFVKLVYQGDNPVLQLFNSREDKDPFQELPLVPSYSVSDIGAQQFDQYGKIFTVKLQYIFYKERPGVRPGQVTKAERLTNKLSQFAAYAIQGDYQGVKEFGSDLKKLGLPVEHAPQVWRHCKV